MSTLNPALNPRGACGRFIPRNSVETVAAIGKAVNVALSNKRTLETLNAVRSKLEALTLRQIRSIKKRYQLKAANADRSTFISKIANRLHSVLMGDSFDFEDLDQLFEALTTEEQTGSLARWLCRKITGADKPITDNDAPGIGRSFERVTRFQALAFSVPHEQYKQLAIETWSIESARIETENAVIREAEKRLGINSRSIDRHENSGRDYSSALKRLDVVASDIASRYPSLGWGIGSDSELGGNDQTEYDRLLWELLHRGRQNVTKTSEEFHAIVETRFQSILYR